MSKPSHSAAKRLLAHQRQMTGLIDKDILSTGDTFIFDKTDWVPLYYDPGYAVRSECGRATAYRAATLDQQVLWLVFAPGKARGYHACASDPVQAIDDAKACWARRRAIKQDWARVQSTARDLIAGRQSITITIEDAHASPLCTMGIEGFLRSIGLRRITRMSGRLAAMLMRIEPQMGFVIYEAMARVAKQERVDTPRAAVPAQ